MIAPILAALLAAAALPASAGAHSCSYNSMSHALYINVSSPSPSEWAGVKRSANRLVVTGNDGSGSAPAPVACTGIAATVTNTDAIHFNAGSFGEARIDLSGGPLAPGFTDEQDGSSEIEADVRQGEWITIEGAEASDQLRAGSLGEDDYLNLNAGEAVSDADVKFDRLHLDLVTNGGDDVVDARGGAGTGDAYRASPYVDAGAGNDVVTGHVHAHGGPGNDDLTAPDVHGDGGDDSLTVLDAAGPNVISGGSGTDTYTVSDPGGLDELQLRGDSGVVRGARVDLAKTGPQDTGQGIETLPPGIDAVDGTQYGDVIMGSSAAETLTGEDGSDVVMGRGGDDTLDGGGISSFGRDQDVVGYADAPGPVNVNIAANVPEATGADGADQLSGFESVIGGPYDDYVNGNAYANRIEGGPGADKLFGNGANDTLVPGTGTGGGSDGGADDVDGGAGTDTVSYADRSAGIAVSLDGLRNDGADADGDGSSSPTEEGDRDANLENVIAGAGADRLVGGSRANTLRGGAGADWLDGGLGADFLSGETGRDTVSYAGRTGPVVVRLDGIRNDGADPNRDGTSTPAEEYDYVYGTENAIGGAGDDMLAASYATRGIANVLTGGPGADFLDAYDESSTVDRLVCGDGVDSFRRDPRDAVDGCDTEVER
ncbi:MAG TPA: hypothetical protein VF533_22290 [Solirubrobacteraceae bacterium]